MADKPLEVGDVVVKPDPDYPGHVIVVRDGKTLGRISAQGLHEAAELDGDRLSEAWVKQKESEDD